MKHTFHIRHFGHVPLIERLVCPVPLTVRGSIYIYGGWARERERRRRRAGDDGPSEELREFSGERKGDDLDEIDI